VNPLKVFRIDDGEHHWYVASDADDAKREHAELMEPNDPESEWEVAEVPDDTIISVWFDDPRDLPKPLPEGAIIEDRKGEWRVRCNATAAAWAATYTTTEQLASSVF